MGRDIKNPVEGMRVKEVIAEDAQVHIGYPSLFHWFKRELVERYIPEPGHDRSTRGPGPHKR